MTIYLYQNCKKKTLSFITIAYVRYEKFSENMILYTLYKQKNVIYLISRF